MTATVVICLAGIIALNAFVFYRGLALGQQRERAIKRAPNVVRFHARRGSIVDRWV